MPMTRHCSCPRRRQMMKHNVCRDNAWRCRFILCRSQQTSHTWTTVGLRVPRGMSSWSEWKTVSSAAQATPGRRHRRLAGLRTGTEARPHLQVPRTSLKGDSRLEFPKSCASGNQALIPTVHSESRWCHSLGRRAALGPGVQGRRAFLRSLCPTWDPRWAAFTRPLNCPCSFTFFLRLSLVLLRGM